ncbi:hypothetical protein CVM73_32090 [Bradyrhizobium forestalis]|uniref:DUF455 domain-containing protein n=1 Tax=Bradyrhizobium forestalis TaxID=1419263 RepID=A0A2M8R0A3_9BRAD|nr:DUF455 family protein [Bradyrhizobium forestalis]PJG51258.1 hypothetical protein CVM73_32090 [Bradyrhizobium forestalis]
MRVAETIDRLKDHLNRCVRISNVLAMWTITTPEAELKTVFGRHLHWAVQAAERLRVRLAELAVDVDPRKLPAQSAADDLKACEDALTTPDKIRALYQRALPNLQASMADHARRTGAIADEPTIRILDDLVAGIAVATSEAHRAFEDVCRTFPNIELESSAAEGHLPPRIPFRPARDRRFSETAADPNLTDTVKLLHVFYTDLELSTIEACSRMIVEFPAMPWQFVIDMARQCWDEARHAEAFRTRLLELGGHLGAYAVSYALWEMGAGEPVDVSLAVQQRVGEWIGVDGAIWQAQQLRFGGDEATSLLFDYVTLDEITHVAFGNKWLRAIAGSEARVKQVHDLALDKRSACGKSVNGPLTFPYNDWACERGGYTEAERDELRARFLKYGSQFKSLETQPEPDRVAIGGR